MQITFNASKHQADAQKTACLIIGLNTKGTLGAAAKAVDAASGGVITKLRKRGDIKGNWAEILVLPAVEGIKAERVLLVGLGGNSPTEKSSTNNSSSDKTGVSDAEFRKLVQTIIACLAELKVEEAVWNLDSIAVTNRDAHWQLTQIGLIATLREYRYTATVSKPKPAFALRKLDLNYASNAASKHAVATGIAIGKGMNAARHLGDLPANFCTPTFLASEARALGRRQKNLKVSVLEEKAMRELGMGALLSVSAGSAEPAKFIVMEYHGGKKGDQPQVLVGKGITFDSGGISIKPASKMDEMKFDMCFHCDY
jgi:leucyl aminopeptidase